MRLRPSLCPRMSSRQRPGLRPSERPSERPSRRPTHLPSLRMNQYDGWSERAQQRQFAAGCKAGGGAPECSFALVGAASHFAEATAAALAEVVTAALAEPPSEGSGSG